MSGYLVVVVLLSLTAFISATSVCDVTVREFTRHCTHRSKRSIMEENTFINRVGGFRTPDEPDIKEYDETPGNEDQARPRRRKSAEDYIRRRIMADNSILAKLEERRKNYADALSKRTPPRTPPRTPVSYDCDYKTVMKLCS